MKYKLADDWRTVEEIILYGYGAVGQACLSSISKDFMVPYIIDNDPKKQKSCIKGLNVYSLKDGLEKRQGRKMIISTGGRTYLEICKILVSKGLKEYEDFCGMEYFITEWYWRYKGLNVLMEIHTAITMQCTLRCKHCNMFVPHYSNNITYNLETLKEEFELLFSKIDIIFCLTLLGGEPLLHPELSKLIQYLFNNYKDKIGVLKIITNGTLGLPDCTLESMVNYPVWFSISDYTKQVKYGNRLNDFIDKLKGYGINHTVTKIESWNDFYFPVNKICIDEEKCYAHMRECAPIFHGYNDKKIYYCHVAWSAEKIGKYKLSQSDYIDLRNITDDESRHKIAEHCLGMLDEGYVSFCQFCGGCGKDNKCIVMAGEQL